MLNNYLFIYGTLLDEPNPFAIFLNENSIFYSKAKFKGRLYDFGDYPGAVDAADGYDIYGSIFELRDVEEVLKHIDPYEGYGEGQRKPYLYIRKIITAETQNGPIDCWVYIYNRSVEGVKQITGGDFMAYKNGLQ